MQQGAALGALPWRGGLERAACRLVSRVPDRHHRRQGGRRGHRPAKPASVHRRARSGDRAGAAVTRQLYVAPLLVLGARSAGSGQRNPGPMTADRLLVAVANRLRPSYAPTHWRATCRVHAGPAGWRRFNVCRRHRRRRPVRVARLQAPSTSRSTSTASRCSSRRASASPSARPATPVLKT